MSSIKSLLSVPNLFGYVLVFALGFYSRGLITESTVIENVDQRVQCQDIEPIVRDVPDAKATLQAQQRANALSKELTATQAEINRLREANRNVRPVQTAVIEVPAECKPIVKHVRVSCDAINDERLRLIQQAYPK